MVYYTRLYTGLLSHSYAKRACRLIPAVLDSPWTVPGLQTYLHRACQPWALLYLVVYHIYHWITFVLTYICLYNVARFPSLYINLALSLLSFPFNIIFISSSLEDVLSSPMDHTPTGSIPATGLRPSAISSPLWGSGWCLTLVASCYSSSSASNLDLFDGEWRTYTRHPSSTIKAICKHYVRFMWTLCQLYVNTLYVQ